MLATRGISLRASPPYAHERNGIAERAIQSIFDVTRALLQQADMSPDLWPVALRHAVYLRNRAPSAALGGRTPLQMLGAPIDSINKLYVFGVKCFVKVDNASRRALEPKARAGVYVGYHDISDSHRVLVKNQTRFDIVDSVHVQVHERELGMPAVLAGERARLSPVASRPRCRTCTCIGFGGF